MEKNPENETKRRTPITLLPRKSLVLAVENPPEHPPTNYAQTLIHIMKGNVGAGMFAMGDGMKNAGLFLGPLLLVLIGFICIHCQHILVNCSQKVKDLRGAEVLEDYADTVKSCFELGPEKFRPMAKGMYMVVNVFLCITQLGFCCIYFVFIGTNVQQILRDSGIEVSIQLVVVVAFFPVLLACLIPNLKWLTPVSLVADIFLFVGFIICLYFATADGFSDIDKLNYYNTPQNVSLFFGTAIFAYEGISLVLPLKNAMKNPRDFNRPLGVLNVAMFFITLSYAAIGICAYMKWGEEVKGSVTLNLGETWLAQLTKSMVSVGILFGYPLQFFIAVQILWPPILLSSAVTRRRPYTGEILFRIALVLLTLGIAVVVPNLGLFISLIGALCSTSLALLIPPIIEVLIIEPERTKCFFSYIYTKNFFIILFALIGFAIGSYESINQIILYYTEKKDKIFS